MPERIELATILLTDLVGSTRLATAVGPVRADELRDEHFAVLREAIASAGGAEVKNTGDGLMVAFASASAAVGCAVQMQQLFERRYRETEQQLHVRIGLGAGESTVQDGDYFGMPSIEAARLCDKAPSDGIVVSAMVKALAGRVEGVAFESVGELELKGFGEPMEAFAVPWSPLGEEGQVLAGWPLPAVLRSVPVVAYVGRESERAAIHRAQAEARGGARQVVLLSGEPGIGKSRLAAYAALEAHRGGWAVAWGACSEDLGVPYEPWIEVCSQLVDHAPVDVLERYVERHGGELSRLVRGLGRRVPGMPPPQASDSETERFLLFSAVAALLTDLAGSVPVVAVLDDFHWADGQSVALLRHVVRATEQSALQIAVTYRESDLGKDHPLTGLLADLHQVPGAERIALTGLGPDEVGQILSAAAGHELDEDGLELAREIATETGGNPFFVGEVLRSLLESGRLLYDEATGRWSVDRASAMGLPQSVREVIEHRVERLGDETRQILTAAAVIGRAFDLEVLLGVVDVDEARLLDHLEAAVSASLLDESTEEVGRFRFVHALINQTLYEALGGTRRARMHHAVGEALEGLHGDSSDDHLGELALHWRLATVAVDKPKAAAYSARAGQQALDRLAPAEAIRLFGDAVELLGAGDMVERCRALIGLGEAQRLIGNASFRETLLAASQIASALEAGDLAARAALENSRGLPSVVGEIDQELLVGIERALELDDGCNPGRRARLLGILALELGYDEAQLERRRGIAWEAIGVARATGDPSSLASVLRDAWQAVWTAETVAQMDEIIEELIPAAERAQDPAVLWWAKADQYTTSVILSRLDLAAARLKEVAAIAEDLEQPMLRWLAHAKRASWEQLHGNLGAAEAEAERALALGQEAAPMNSALYYAACLTFVRTHQGRGEEVVGILEASVANYPGLPSWRAGLASGYCRLDRLDDARAIIEDASRDRFEHIPHDAVRMTALVLYADVAAHTGSVDAAGYLYELLEPWADQVIYTDVLGYGHARMYLGELAHTIGKPGEAIHHLEFACRFHEESAMLLWAAESHLSLARVLAAQADPDGARAHASRALELAREHGYGVIERWAAALIDADVPTQA